MSLKTSGAVELTLARSVVDGAATVSSGWRLRSHSMPTEPLVLHKEGAAWAKGPATHTGVFKHGHVTGPIRDVFHEPITFVYADGDEVRTNEKVARAFADRPGIPAGYPMMTDTEFLARKEPLANDRALFLVGRTNKVLAALEAAGCRSASTQGR